MNAYREHRVRTSLGRSAAAAPESPEQLRERAAALWRSGRGIMFFFEQIAAMSPQERAALEAAGRRLYGPREGDR